MIYRKCSSEAWHSINRNHCDSDFYGLWRQCGEMLGPPHSLVFSDKGRGLCSQTSNPDPTTWNE